MIFEKIKLFYSKQIYFRFSNLSTLSKSKPAMDNFPVKQNYGSPVYFDYKQKFVTYCFIICQNAAHITAKFMVNFSI